MPHKVEVHPLLKAKFKTLFQAVPTVNFLKLAHFCNTNFQAFRLKNRYIPGIFDQCNNGRCKWIHKAATKEEAEKLVTAFNKVLKNPEEVTGKIGT
eukprot:9642338-Ditylum_brightwellii.AAC.1